MIWTVGSIKAGVGKTTTVVYLVASLQTPASTLLIDSDLNRSASSCFECGSLPFRVIDERQAARFSGYFEHVVIDT